MSAGAWTPVTGWMRASDDPYEQRKRLANDDPKNEYLVEERDGEVRPLREYRVISRSRS